MERDFLKQSIRRELDYYRDGLFNEDGDEEWVRAWSAPDDDDSMAENGFLNVAMAHLTGDECDEIVLLSRGELEVVEKSNLDDHAFKEKIIAALKEESYA